jgi:hypothetical protein
LEVFSGQRLSKGLDGGGEEFGRGRGLNCEDAEDAKDSGGVEVEPGLGWPAGDEGKPGGGGIGVNLIWMWQAIVCVCPLESDVITSDFRLTIFNF